MSRWLTVMIHGEYYIASGFFHLRMTNYFKAIFTSLHAKKSFLKEILGYLVSFRG